MIRTQEILWALTTCALLCGTARADTVYGTVVDTKNAPAPNVKVYFSGILLPFRTNALGVFIATVPTGTYTVAVIPSLKTLAAVRFLSVQVFISKNMGTIVVKPGSLVTGIVIDPANKVVQAAGLDFIDESSGTEIFTPGDGTDALGHFSVVVPVATYTIHIRPPVARTGLVRTTMRNVLIAAVKDFGNIKLNPGAVVSGRVVNSVTKLPIANVDLDAEDRFGNEIFLSNDRTSSTGTFAVVLPMGLVSLSFDAPRATNHVGLELRNLNITASMSVGTVEMVKGFNLTGLVLASGARPVVNADIDIDTAVGGVRIFTPHDNTDSTGRFSVVVPKGSYTIKVEPQKSNLLVGTLSSAIAVNANTVAPTVTLVPGVLLSGVVTGYNGKPEFDLDIDVVHPTTGVEVITPQDNTDTLGRYSVVIPTGTWNVRFQSGKVSLSLVKTVTNVSVLGPTTLNQTLTLVPIGTYFGTRGVPTITNGGQVIAILAFINPTTQIQKTRANIVFTDPLGKESTLLGPLFLTIPSGFSYMSVFLLPTFPINPSLLGLQCRMAARFDDPITGAQQDHSSFKFFVK